MTLSLVEFFASLERRHPMVHLMQVNRAPVFPYAM
jgi:hypothetical protein